MEKRTQKRDMSRVDLGVLMLCCLLCLLWTASGCGGAPAAEAVDEPATESFSFIYMGDPQADPESGDYTAWGRLLQQAAENPRKPAFLLLGGDLVNDGNDPAEWAAFFEAGGEALETLPVYPAVGNHDNAELFLEMFELDSAFYSFDYGNTHFTVMDSNLMGAANSEDVLWLEEDLAAAEGAAHKIVMFHHPVWPATEVYKDSLRAETLQTTFMPVMEEYGVELVLGGHQHVYMRTQPLLGGEEAEKGIVYLMGTSGGKQYQPSSKDYMAYALGDMPVYTIVTVAGGGLQIETFDSEGNLVDEYRWEH